LSASPNKDAALALASRGLRVFACNADKTPRVAAWEQAASSSPFEIGVKWDAAPESIPAIPVGAHGLIVIDADRKSGGADGVAAFNALCAEHGLDQSKFFVVETPNRGLHVYFRTQTPYGNSRGTLPDGIDVRGLGGYVIAPGSTLPDGRSYRHVYGSWDAIPPLPETLASLLREKRPVASLPPASTVDASLIGQRERLCAAAALVDEVAKLRAMGEGSGRNRALNEAAHSLGTMDGWIDLNEVANALWDASIANCYVAKDGESAAKQTIISGLAAGRTKPRALLSHGGISDEYISQTQTNLINQYKSKQVAPFSTNGKRSVTLLQGSSIVEVPITWLWDGYLPSGKLTLLAGAGGTGKSTIAFNLAATITNGGLWPDGSQCKTAGNVLIWSSEDDPADTIKPRLMAVGANDSRYGVISGTVDEKGFTDSFDAARDMEGLREAVRRIGGISLLIIDPIVTAVTGDMHKANDVRRSLQPIIDFAAECDCAVLGITHFAKGTAGKNSAERVIGSQAFAAQARMVLVAAKEEESNRRVFTRAKSNNSIDTGGYSYTIEALTLNQDIVATCVVWGEALEGSSRSILAQVEEEDIPQSGQKSEEARNFLYRVLANGPVPVVQVKAQARVEGIAPVTLQRVKESMNIQSLKTKGEFVGGWDWMLAHH
jgi:AAA domain/Bifunctional DNA primase/polymerase, N-terminal